MYEHYRQPLLPRSAFIIRFIRCAFISLALLIVTIFIGAFAYHYLEKLSWIDAILNSVMIMTGLGMVAVLNTSKAKIFTTFYAIFSTIVFFAMIAILFSPLIHRFMHRFHLEIDRKSKVG